MTYKPTDKEEATKARLQNIGATLRSSNPNHQSSLRAQLISPAPVHVKTSPRNWKWFLAPMGGVLAVFVLIVVANQVRQPQMIDTYYDDVLVSDVSNTLGDASGLSGETGLSSGRSYIPSMPWKRNVSKNEIAEYQDTYGTSLEENRQYRVLTKDLDDKENVQDLFTLYEGSVERVSDTVNRFNIVVTIPQTDIERFQDRIQDLASKDKYFSINGAGVSRTLDLMRAPTDEARQKIQDDVDYVDVIVTLEKMPSLWSTSSYDVKRVIAGYSDPGLFQSILIMFVFMTSMAIVFLTATFWFIIPLGYWIWRRKKTKSTLRFMD